MLKYETENMNLQKKKKDKWIFALGYATSHIFFPNLLKNVKKKEKEMMTYWMIYF
jgi:hypothetical protein